MAAKVEKPVVFYDLTRGAHVNVGGRAIVWPINHPSVDVSNDSFVTTSPVLSYSVTSGEFETQNTIYKPTSPCQIGNMNSSHTSSTQGAGC